MRDIKIIQTNDGGELVLTSNDLAVVNGVENTLYLALFGGTDWVGNFLVDRPYNSRTEATLRAVTLNSDGRLQILQAVNSDLAYLADIPGTTWSADVIITGPYSVTITVTINGETFSYYFNPVAEGTTEATAEVLCPLITGLAATPDGADTIDVSWDSSYAIGYQYAYNTTGDAPADEDWIDTTANSVAITGLSAYTEYHVFVRNVCSATVFSAYDTTTATTDAEAPVLPLLIDPVLSVWSTVGVTETAGVLTAWADQSPENNDLTPATTGPTVEAGVFGVYPGLSFDAMHPTNAVGTAGLFSGISGLPSCTVFVVMKAPAPSSASLLVNYSNTPGVIAAGEFELYTQMPAMQPEVNALMKGDVGLNLGQMPWTADTAFVLCADMDFSKAALAELRMYKNNSDADYVAGPSANNTGTFTTAPLGAGGFAGYIGAIVIYPTSLNNTDRAAVDTYLRSYFSIA